VKINLSKIHQTLKINTRIANIKTTRIQTKHYMKNARRHEKNEEIWLNQEKGTGNKKLDLVIFYNFSTKGV